jgi:hypothetical protein
MRWSVLALLGSLAIATVTAVPVAMADGPKDYAILIISRQTLQVSTSCEIGVYISDQLVTRLYQEEDTSLNLPPGEISVRLKRLAAETPGCEPSGITTSPATRIKLHAGDVVKYAIAPGPYGLYLKPAPIEY